MKPILFFVEVSFLLQVSTESTLRRLVSEEKILEESLEISNYHF